MHRPMSDQQQSNVLGTVLRGARRLARLPDARQRSQHFAAMAHPAADAAGSVPAWPFVSHADYSPPAPFVSYSEGAYAAPPAFIGIDELARYIGDDSKERRMAEELMAALDVDGDGRCSLREWRQAWFAKQEILSKFKIAAVPGAESFHDLVDDARVKQRGGLLSRLGCGGAARDDSAAMGAAHVDDVSYVEHYQEHQSQVPMAISPSRTTYSDLFTRRRRRQRQRQGGRVKIARTEERGVTIPQLRRVWAHIQRRCEPERWTNFAGELITAEEANLYDACRYVIKPATYELRCSYVELVARGPQPPRWFVSHWWGEPVVQFLACLEQHAADHGLEADAAYWVCAYANNQHALEDDVTTDPAQSAFVKAIKLAEGRVLSVLDEGGVCYTRIWCILELHRALAGTYNIYTAREGCTAYDLARVDELKHAVGREKRGREWYEEVLARLPVVKDRRAVGLTDGPAKVDGTWVAAAVQVYRQSSFPVELVRRIFDVRVQDARASFDADRVRILNFIAGRALDQEPLDACGPYDDMNTQLHGRYLAAAFRVLLEGGDDVSLRVGVLASSHLGRLALCFRGCPAFTDDTARLLASHLPPTLEELHIDLVASGATHVGGNALLAGVLRSVRLGGLRVLSMFDCLLSGPIPPALGACGSLTILHLAGNALSGEIPGAIGHCTRLEELHLQNNQLAGPVPSFLGSLVNLKLLRLNGNRGLTGRIPEALAQCTALEQLQCDEALLAAGLPAALEQRRHEGLLWMGRRDEAARQQTRREASRQHSRQQSTPRPTLAEPSVPEQPVSSWHGWWKTRMLRRRA